MTLSSAQAIQVRPATPTSQVARQTKIRPQSDTELDEIVDYLESKHPVYSVLRDVQSDKLRNWAGRVTGNPEKDRALEREIAQDLAGRMAKEPGVTKGKSWNIKERLLDLSVAALPTGLTAFTCAIPVVGPGTTVALVATLGHKLVEGSSLPDAVKTVASIGIVGAAIPAMGLAALASVVPGLTLPICALSSGLSALTLGGMVAADKAGLIKPTHHLG